MRNYPLLLASIPTGFLSIFAFLMGTYEVTVLAGFLAVYFFCAGWVGEGL